MDFPKALKTLFKRRLIKTEQHNKTRYLSLIIPIYRFSKKDSLRKIFQMFFLNKF
jgi:hypothetical protein